MRQSQAPNLQAVLDWVRANRPDVLAQFEEIARPDTRPDPRRDGFLFLITVGFQAGRQYQVDHPEFGVHSYHTDDPRLPRQPPVKSADIKR